MTDLVLENTPWEVYQLDGVDIHVKREDLSCPHPGPSFSKIRGVESVIDNLDSLVYHVGVLDTFHSKAGWGVSYVCADVGVQSHVFYPVYKAEGTLDSHDLRHNQQQCQALGATLHPLQAGRSAILYHQAKKRLSQLGNVLDAETYMFPNGLKLYATVDATAAEAEAHTPDELFEGTWVCSISSGTICAGLLQALSCEPVAVVAHLGYSRSIETAMRYMLDKAGVDSLSWRDRLTLIDEGYAYKEAAKGRCPFPCNQYYDLKAWLWLEANIHELEQPIIFWNIGA